MQDTPAAQLEFLRALTGSGRRKAAIPCCRPQ